MPTEPASNPVLYCDCANTKNISVPLKERVLTALRKTDRPVIAVADLCGIAAAADPCLKIIAEAPAATIIACYPRAVLGLFHRAGCGLNRKNIEFLNLRTQPAAEIISALQGGDQSGTAETRKIAIESTRGTAWRPWFPVIDYLRCVNCRQCLDFCLFGVYDTDQNDLVTVAKPANCKDNCPSCARMCPHLAIMFPKIDEQSPINGSEADSESAPGKVLLTEEQLFGADAVDRLRARRKGPDLFLNR